MMKKFTSALVALCLTMTMSLASADEVVLFKGSAGAGWQAYEKVLVAEKHLVDGSFPTYVLAWTMLGYVQDKSLFGKEKEKVEYTKLFKQAYGLGDTITTDEFRRLGQAGHFALSTMTAALERQAKADAASVAKTEVAPVAVVQAPVAATAASASVAAPVVTEKENAQLAKLGSDLANLKEELVTVQESITKSGGNQKQINAKIAEIDSQKTQLNVLKLRLDDFEKKGVVSPAMRAEITEMQTRIGNHKIEINSIIGKVEDKLNPRFSAIEGSVGLQNKASGFLAAILVLVGAAVWINWRRTNSAKEEFAAVKTDFAAVKAESVAAMVKAKAVEQEVSKVKDRVADLESKPRLVLPTDFDYQVDALRADGSVYEFQVYTEENPDKEYLLSIERYEIDYGIFGIKDLTTTVSRKGLKMAMFNAAKIKNGQSRLVGVKKDVVIAPVEATINQAIV